MNPHKKSTVHVNIALCHGSYGGQGVFQFIPGDAGWIPGGLGPMISDHIMI